MGLNPNYYHGIILVQRQTWRTISCSCRKQWCISIPQSIDWVVLRQWHTVAVPYSCCVDLQLKGAQQRCGMGRFYKGNWQSSVWNRTSLHSTAKWKRGITVRQIRVSLIFQLLIMSRYPETPRLHEDFLNEHRLLMHTHASPCTRSHSHSLPADLWEQPFQENLSLPYVVNVLAAGQSSMQAACV